MFERLICWKYEVQFALEDAKDKIVEVVQDQIDHSIDVMDTLTTDVKIEGKKQGYMRASVEFSQVLNDLEILYNKTIQYIQLQKKQLNADMDEWITKLAELEDQKESLEKQKKNIVKKVSVRLDVPVSAINTALCEGSIFTSNMSFMRLGILELIYKHKKEIFWEEEKKGYNQARKEYEDKIKKLKKKLDELISKGENELSEFQMQIKEILEDIEEIKLEIAELKLML